MEKFEGPLEDLWEMPNLPNIKYRYELQVVRFFLTHCVCSVLFDFFK